MRYATVLEALKKSAADIKQSKRTTIRLGSGDGLRDRIENRHIGILLYLLGPNAPVYELDVTSDKIDDRGLKMMLRFKNLRCLSINLYHITNEAANYINQHPRLAYLYITGRNIDHQAFRTLAQNPRFKMLDFPRCYSIKEVHTDDFAPDTQLTTLRLSCSPIGDAGVQVLAKLPFLKELQISDVKMTNLSATALLANNNLVKINMSKPVWYHKIGWDNEQKIKAHIKKNRQRVRTEFVQAMLTVFTGKPNADTFTLANLPIELKIHIFNCFDFNALRRSVGVGQACVQFVVNHLEEIQQRIHQKASIQFSYERAGQDIWRYFFKQPFAAEDSLPAIAPAAGKRKLDESSINPLAENISALQRPRLR